MATSAERPARRRVRDPEDKQRRILAAAAAEFAAHGPAATRTEDIAARAGVNKQLLFRYFESKQGLFRAVLEQMFDRFDEVFNQPPDDIGDRLAYYVDAVSADRQWGALQTWEALEFGEDPVVRETPRRDQFAAEVERLRADQAAGRLPAHLDPAQLLLSIQSLTAFCYALPQYTRLVTGLDASDPEFGRQRREHLRELGRLLQAAATTPSRATGS